MDSRERVLAALNHKQPDRVPIHDNPWETTLHRWYEEGLPKDVPLDEYFGFEFEGFGFDGTLMLPTEIVEETEEYVIMKNANGATVKNWKHKTSTPELIEFSLTTPEKWAELKTNLCFKPKRINWKEDGPRYERARQKGKFTHLAVAIGYDELSSIVGPITLLSAMMTEPEWVSDMYRVFMDVKLACIEEMTAIGCEFDGAFVYDDLGYKNGPFFSTATYRELLLPHHKRLCDLLHGKGLKVILHSCGNVMVHIPALIEAGFDCLQPLEVKAGMDLVMLKKQYGEQLAFMGGIDVRKMADKNPKVIEKEIKTKVNFAKKGGGYIYHSDHSVPDNVSLEQYKHVLELIRKYGRY